MAIIANIPVITNVNGLNALIKRQRLAEWIQKHASYKRVTSDLKTRVDTVKRRRGIPCKWKSKENNTVQDKIDFKTKIVEEVKKDITWQSRDQGRYNNGNIETLNMGPPKFIKQILTDIKGKTDNHAIIVENFHSWITSMDRLSR